MEKGTRISIEQVANGFIVRETHALAGGICATHVFDQHHKLVEFMRMHFSAGPVGAEIKPPEQKPVIAPPNVSLRRASDKRIVALTGL